MKKLAALLLFVFFTTCIPAQGFLHTRGYDIVDEKGNKVFLKGVGLGNWMLPEGYMWKFQGKADRPRNIEKVVSDLIGPEEAARFWTEFRKSYVTEADIRRIAELGFNSVRPAMNARLFLTEGADARFIDDGFLLLDNLIGWCKKYGVYVILDMHGAPGGQTGQNIDDSPADLPGLFMDPVQQDRLVALWVRLAQRYKDEPTVAAYDLLNEPLPENTGAAAKYGALLEPLYKRITQAIREVDQRHMITLEGMNWANDWSVFSKPIDPNLFYQFHYYCWEEPDHLRSVDYFIRQRERLGTPVWIGETGEQQKAVYWGTSQYFESLNMGWSFWPWKKMDTRNTPYSILKPAGWDLITAYTAGAAKPDAETARKAFQELLANIRLVNCVYFPDVVNALFNRVPACVEAENYGHKGYGVSYIVKDTSARSAYYRTEEPVPVEAYDSAEATEDLRQYIRLEPEEWVTYDIRSQCRQALDGRIRVKALGGNARALLTIGNESIEIAPVGAEWVEIPVGNRVFDAGNNPCRFRVVSGTLAVDYLDFR
jgi:endoglucanase